MLRRRFIKQVQFILSRTDAERKSWDIGHTRLIAHHPNNIVYLLSVDRQFGCFQATAENRIGQGTAKFMTNGPLPMAASPSINDT